MTTISEPREAGPAKSAGESPGTPPGHEDAPVPPGKLGLALAVVALGGLLFGFDTGVIPGALLFLKADFQLTSLQEATVISSLLLGAAVGALRGGRPADRRGRRKTLLVAALPFAPGLALATFVLQRVPETRNRPFAVIQQDLMAVTAGRAGAHDAP